MLLASRLALMFLLCLLPCNLIMHTQQLAFAQEDDAEDAVVEEVDEDDEDEDEDDTAAAETDAEDDDDDEEDSDGVGSSSDVDLKIIFPEHNDLSFPAGSIVTALIGFHNKGQNAFTVQSIEASFRHLQDFSYFIQNFTNQAVNQEVKSQEHATFLYKFQPHESFDPRDFGFVLNVNYIDNNEAFYRHPAINSTIHVVESVEPYDTKALFAYASTFAVAVLAFIVFKQKTAPKPAAPKKVKSTSESGTESVSATDDDNWLTNANIPASLRNKAKKAQK